MDVNHDGKVTALDALVIINQLARDRIELPASAVDARRVSLDQGLPSYDVNDDGRVSAIDALQVINRLSRSQSTTANGEQLFAAAQLRPIEAWESLTESDSIDDDLLSMLADDMMRVTLDHSLN